MRLHRRLLRHTVTSSTSIDIERFNVSQELVAVLVTDECSGDMLVLPSLTLLFCWNSVEASADRKSCDMAIGLNDV